MKKLDLDWKKLGFNYMKTNAIYVAHYKDGAWDAGSLVADDRINISIGSTALHYGQQCFEGMKAYETKDGRVQLFRPELNAERMRKSCERLLMPCVSEEQFLYGCRQVIKANEEYIPPYDSGCTLYLRPMTIGVGDNMGMRPAKEYMFIIFCSPVGNNYKGTLVPVDFVTTEYDRAAPNGTGKAKVGGNYAASLMPHKLANDMGYTDCIYLDAVTHTKIEEVGAANFYGITKDNVFVTPKSPSILESITRRSLEVIARDYLKIEAIETDIYIDEIHNLKEAGACGTGAIITPISSITHKGKKTVFGEKAGEITVELHKTLLGIQKGDIEAPDGWIKVVE